MLDAQSNISGLPQGHHIMYTPQIIAKKSSLKRKMGRGNGGHVNSEHFLNLARSSLFLSGTVFCTLSSVVGFLSGFRLVLNRICKIAYQFFFPVPARAGNYPIILFRALYIALFQGLANSIQKNYP